MMLIISTYDAREDTFSSPADGGRQAVRRIIGQITQIGPNRPNYLYLVQRPNGILGQEDWQKKHKMLYNHKKGWMAVLLSIV